MALLEWFKRLKVVCRKWLFDLKWKGTLPEEFDVFFLEHFKSEEHHLVFPGDVYTADSFVVNHLTIKGNFFAGGYVECGELNVYENLISQDFIDCLTAQVGQVLDCHDIQSWEDSVIVSDYECQCYELMI